MVYGIYYHQYKEINMQHITHSRRPLRQRAAPNLATAICIGLAGAFGAGVAAQAAPIATAVVGTQNSEVTSYLDGVIQPVRQSTVSSQVSGRIATFLVKAGDRVKAGQLLAAIDDREASVGQQRSQAQVDQAQADLRNAQANYNRNKDLQTKGFVSRAALDTADAQLKSAQALRDQATAAIRQSNLAQSFTQVTAPFEGWVLHTDAQAGDLAVPGKPLLVLYAPLPIRVVVQVPASRAAEIGDAADIQVKAGNVDPAGWITPSSRSLVPSADPVSQTTEWRLELPAAQSAGLIPGQQVRVKFSAAQAVTRQTLVVPDQAIVRRGELTAVYVQSGLAFSLRAVRLGQKLGAQGTEVLAGLKSGDVVALDPVRAAQPPAAR